MTFENVVDFFISLLPPTLEDLGDLCIALLPSAGAILAERIELVNRDDLLKDAGEALREEGQAEDNVIKEIIATTAEGASEYVGLVPTCISALLTGFAVLRELWKFQRSLWPTILYVIFLGVISVLMMKLLKGLSYHAIADKPKEFFRGRITRTPKQMISYTIYFLNFTLILLALVVFPLKWAHQ
jgi:hypothetical protein